VVSKNISDILSYYISTGNPPITKPQKQSGPETLPHSSTEQLAVSTSFSGRIQKNICPNEANGRVPIDRHKAGKSRKNNIFCKFINTLLKGRGGEEGQP
jgi:hypothetical protein